MYLFKAYTQTHSHHYNVTKGEKPGYCTLNTSASRVFEEGNEDVGDKAGKQVKYRPIGGPFLCQAINCWYCSHHHKSPFLMPAFETPSEKFDDRTQLGLSCTRGARSFLFLTVASDNRGSPILTFAEIKPTL